MDTKSKPKMGAFMWMIILGLIVGGCMLLQYGASHAPFGFLMGCGVIGIVVAVSGLITNLAIYPKMEKMNEERSTLLFAWDRARYAIESYDTWKFLLHAKVEIMRTLMEELREKLNPAKMKELEDAFASCLETYADIIVDWQTILTPKSGELKVKNTVAAYQELRSMYEGHRERVFDALESMRQLQLLWVKTFRTINTDQSDPFDGMTVEEFRKIAELPGFTKLLELAKKLGVEGDAENKTIPKATPSKRYPEHPTEQFEKLADVATDPAMADFVKRVTGEDPAN
jgi:hypothetical protein